MQSAVHGGDASGADVAAEPSDADKRAYVELDAELDTGKLEKAGEWLKAAKAHDRLSRHRGCLARDDKHSDAAIAYSKHGDYTKALARIRKALDICGATSEEDGHQIKLAGFLGNESDIYFAHAKVSDSDDVVKAALRKTKLALQQRIEALEAVQTGNLAAKQKARVEVERVDNYLQVSRQCFQRYYKGQAAIKANNFADAWQHFNACVGDIQEKAYCHHMMAHCVQMQRQERRDAAEKNMKLAVVEAVRNNNPGTPLDSALAQSLGDLNALGDCELPRAQAIKHFEDSIAHEEQGSEMWAEKKLMFVEYLCWERLYDQAQQNIDSIGYELPPKAARWKDQIAREKTVSEQAAQFFIKGEAIMNATGLPDKRRAEAAEFCFVRAAHGEPGRVQWQLSHVYELAGETDKAIACMEAGITAAETATTGTAVILEDEGLLEAYVWLATLQWWELDEREQALSTCARFDAAVSRRAAAGQGEATPELVEQVQELRGAILQDQEVSETGGSCTLAADGSAFRWTAPQRRARRDHADGTPQLVDHTFDVKTLYFAIIAARNAQQDEGGVIWNDMSAVDTVSDSVTSGTVVRIERGNFAKLPTSKELQRTGWVQCIVHANGWDECRSRRIKTADFLAMPAAPRVVAAAAPQKRERVEAGWRGGGRADHAASGVEGSAAPKRPKLEAASSSGGTGLVGTDTTAGAAAASHRSSPSSPKRSKQVAAASAASAAGAAASAHRPARRSRPASPPHSPELSAGTTEPPLEPLVCRTSARQFRQPAGGGAAAAATEDVDDDDDDDDELLNAAVAAVKVAVRAARRPCARRMDLTAAGVLEHVQQVARTMSTEEKLQLQASVTSVLFL
jgi:tetratricopeptide (TPR) repeat protein